VPGADGFDAVHTALVFHDAGDTGPLAVVLGRHDHCDLAEIPGAALRHALVLMWPAAHGDAARLEALDLKTGIGLGTTGGEVALHVEGTQALRFGVGVADVVAVGAAPGAPLFDGSPEDLLARLAREPTPVRRHAPEPGVPLAQLAELVEQQAASDHAPRLEVGSEKPSESDAVSALDDSAAVVGFTRATRSKIVTSSHFAAQMQAEASPTDVPVLVHAAWSALEEGLLLGRYERCAAHESLAEDSGVSRVHAALLVRRDSLFVIDTGSTNGTRVKRDDGSVVELGRGKRVHRAAATDELLLHHARVVVVTDA
jgi:hypothetical protein